MHTSFGREITILDILPRKTCMSVPRYMLGNVYYNIFGMENHAKWSQNLFAEDYINWGISIEWYVTYQWKQMN